MFLLMVQSRSEDNPLIKASKPTLLCLSDLVFETMCCLSVGGMFFVFCLLVFVKLLFSVLDTHFTPMMSCWLFLVLCHAWLWRIPHYNLEKSFWSWSCSFDSFCVGCVFTFPFRVYLFVSCLFHLSLSLSLSLSLFLSLFCLCCPCFASLCFLVFAQEC